MLASIMGILYISKVGASGSASARPLPSTRSSENERGTMQFHFGHPNKKFL